MTRHIFLSLVLAACGATEPAPKPAPEKPAVKAKADAHAGHDMKKKADAHADDMKKKAEPLGAFKPLAKGLGTIQFKEPADGATVKSPVHLVFTAENLAVVPAGEMKPTSGHHHIIVDGKPIAAGVAVPKDATHIHYGGGQTEADVELEPGKHTLTMQFADFAHRSYGPDYASTITVTVE